MTAYCRVEREEHRIQPNRIVSNRVRSDPIETIERNETGYDGRVTIQKNNYVFLTRNRYISKIKTIISI